MSTSEADRQKTIKDNFSSYKGNKKRKEINSGSSSSSGGQTSEEYRESTAAMSAEEQQAGRLISDSVDRGSGVNRTQQALNQIQQSQSQSTQNNIVGSSSQDKLIVENSPVKPDYLISQYPESDYRSHIDPDKSIIGIAKSKLQSLNEKISEYIPSYEELEEKQAQRSKSLDSPAYQEAIDNLQPVESDPAKEITQGLYNEVESNPVGVAATAASMYVGGAALKLVSTGGRAALATGAELAGTGTKAAQGLNLLSKSVEPAIAVGGLTLTAHEINTQVNAPITTQTDFYDESGNLINTEIETTEPTTAEKYERLGEITPHLMAGLYGGVKGYSGSGLPKIKPTQLLIQEGKNTNVPLELGRTLTIGEKPVVSFVKGEGLQRGAGSAPLEVIKNLDGSTITAYSKLETATFRNTLAKLNPKEKEFFDSALNLASNIHSQNRPIVKPNSFEVMSEHIPVSSRPLVRDAIKTYKGDIDVYGSVTQKLQMGDTFTRSPKDIEVMVDNPQKFLQHLTQHVDSSSVKIKNPESLDPKVMFKNSEGVYEKGIEVFGKDLSLEGSTGYVPKNEIAYGFNSKNLVKVDGVKMMQLSEQGGRKLEGGHVLRDGVIQPKHEGRVKDLPDLIEIGAGYASQNKISDAAVYKYALQAVERFPEIRNSPVVDYIIKYQKAPSREVYAKLTQESGITSSRELMYRGHNSKRSSDVNIPSSPAVSSPVVSSPRSVPSSIFTSSPAVSSPVASSPRSVPSSIATSSPAVSSPVVSSPRSTPSSIATSSPAVSSPVVSSSRSSSSVRSSSRSGSALVRRPNKSSSEFIEKPKFNQKSSKNKSDFGTAWKYKRAKNKFSDEVKVKSNVNIKGRF